MARWTVLPNLLEEMHRRNPNTFINLVGGIVIGILQYDLSLDQAAKAHGCYRRWFGGTNTGLNHLSSNGPIARVVTVESAPEQLSQLANPMAFFILGNPYLVGPNPRDA